MRIWIKFAFYLVVLIQVSSVKAGTYEDFFRAVNVDNERTVGQLLARGFDPNTRDERGQAALFVALQSESVKVAETLLAHPAIQIDLANDKGETPVMIAALRGQVEWTEKLLQRGAQVNRTGWTPLHYAASGPEPQVVALLLTRRAVVDAPSPNGTTPLMMAARYGDEGSVQRLLAAGADPRRRNDQGLNAADFARLAAREGLTRRLDELAR